MKTFGILGNCQSRPLANYLLTSEEFSSEYAYKNIPPVHTIDVLEDVHLISEIASLDLLIYQPITDENRFRSFTSNNVLKLLNEEALSICIPSMYYGGYHPTMESVEGIEGPLRGVHDFLIIGAYLAGYDEQKIINLVSNDYPLNKNQINLHHNFSLDMLEKREADFQVDVPISGFIREKFREVKLFHTFNHPTPAMMAYVSSQIVTILGLNNSIEEGDDFLDDIVAPIYRSVSVALGLNFEEPVMKNVEKIYTIPEFVFNSLAIYKNVNRESLVKKLLQKKKFLLDYFVIKC